MTKILSISNSFGVDATRYLYGISRAAKHNVKIVTLYIGGCSLYRHYRNMLSEAPAYEYYIDGIATGIFISLKDALLSDEWDYVTLQQSSPKSADTESYFPYITELSAYVRKLAPGAKQYIMSTWSFAEGHKRFALTGYDTRDQMIPAVRAAYARASEAIGGAPIIPALEAMSRLYDEIGEATYRDGFHCSYGVARYMLGCLWFNVFFGEDLSENSFRDFDVEVTEDEIDLARRIARECAIDAGFEVK